MSIFINENSKIIVQGITGKEGMFHTKECLKYGTNIVAGVTPGKGGQNIYGIKIFDTVQKAKNKTNANCSIIFVPPKFANEAIIESIDAKIDIIVCITEGIPILDMMKIKNYISNTKSRLIGPNCPGIITPGACKIGIMPSIIHKPNGPIGVISRSGTLTYEVVYQLTKKNIGQSTCIGIGGDPIIGTDFIDCLKAFQKDNKTKGIVMIGEIGGNNEEKAAEFIKKFVSKPVIGFIAGLTAPKGKRMGHAGAIINNEEGTAKNKITILKKNGIHVSEDLTTFGDFCSKIFKKII